MGKLDEIEEVDEFGNFVTGAHTVHEIKAPAVSFEQQVEFVYRQQKRVEQRQAKKKGLAPFFRQTNSMTCYPVLRLLHSDPDQASNQVMGALPMLVVMGQEDLQPIATRSALVYCANCSVLSLRRCPTVTSERK